MTLRELFTDYRKKGLAIPAFNIDCFETFQALEEIVLDTKTPVIAQLSPGELKFIKPQRLVALTNLLTKKDLPIFLNVDHGRDLDSLKRVIDLGFDMIHFDGSDLPFQDNLKLATQITSYAHQKNALVEVEFDRIQPIGNKLSVDSFTDPDRAKTFMQTTQADLLAVSVGNLHGVDVNCPETLDLPRLSKISQKLPDNFLVMHGGSGIDPKDLKTAIQHKIVKINVNTDLRLAFKAHLQASLSSTDTIKAYTILSAPIQAIKDKMKEKLDLFSKHV